jgi:hypothetical protein
MSNKGGIGSHTTPNQGATNTWLTPESIVKALGCFDLDPCAAPSPRPWPTAKFHIELPEDGLAASWYGNWCIHCGALDPHYLNEYGCTPAPGDPCHLCGTATTSHRQPFRVYCNPPYGQETEAWLKKMSNHRCGIALIFARTETSTWMNFVWPLAHSIFFFDGRLFFHHADGTRGKSNAGGPSALISYSNADTQAIRDSGLKGQLVTGWERCA